MSTYSLQILNSEKYSQEFEESILYSYDAYIYKNNFRVGDGIKDENELKHNLIYSRILCEDNCEIINYIQDKIDGKLETKCRKKRTVSETLISYFNEESSRKASMCQQSSTYTPVWTEASW